MPMDHDAMRATIASTIKTARTERGISQGDLGQAISLDQSTVSNMERGTQGVTLEQLWAIEEALDLPTGTILRRAGYLTDAPTVEEAIAGDPTISERDREVILRVYRTREGRPTRR